jgi:hypothetical protein
LVFLHNSLSGFVLGLFGLLDSFLSKLAVFYGLEWFWDVGCW